MALGSEPIGSDVTELHAVVDSLEQAPLLPVAICTDSSYNMHHASDHRARQRRHTRSSNRALTNRLVQALQTRITCGAPTALIKCTSHNRDPTQDPLITKLNDYADSQATWAALPDSSATHIYEPWPQGEDEFALLDGGHTVRGDPRRSIRKASRLRIWHKYQSLDSDGFTAHVMDPTKQLVNTTAIRDLRSRHMLASNGALSLYGFPACWIRGPSGPPEPYYTF